MCNTVSFNSYSILQFQSNNSNVQCSLSSTWQMSYNEELYHKGSREVGILSETIMHCCVVMDMISITSKIVI